MARKVSLSYQQAAKLSLQAFDRARNDLEEIMVIPTRHLSDINDSDGEFVRVSQVYLGDFFSAIDIVFTLNGKQYLFTVEQDTDGYCSGFDPDYNHVATEIKRNKRRRR